MALVRRSAVTRSREIERQQAKSNLLRVRSGRRLLSRVDVQASKLVSVDRPHHPRGEQALEETADTAGAVPLGANADFGPAAGGWVDNEVVTVPAPIPPPIPFGAFDEQSIERVGRERCDPIILVVEAVPVGDTGEVCVAATCGCRCCGG